MYLCLGGLDATEEADVTVNGHRSSGFLVYYPWHLSFVSHLNPVTENFAVLSLFCDFGVFSF